MEAKERGVASEPEEARGGASAAPAAAELKEGDYILFSGLASRPELNGKPGKIIGALSDGRFPVSVDGAVNIRVKPAHLEYRDPEGLIFDGRIMLCGEWFPMEDFGRYMFGEGPVVSDAFGALDKKGQADVLSGRVPLDLPSGPAD